ncbi:hypothetical protein K438DRAFT_1804998 [Mycena galopus ATCC 62051]|nr:hypothetical protein K438DRAFT_1804998 [Mycena galopus ATCC 62051]
MSTSEKEKYLSTGSKETSGPKISKSLIPHSTHALKVLLSGSLNKSTPDSTWTMFETNMRTTCHHLFTPFGRDPPKQQEEWFNRISRFIPVYPTDDTDALIAFTVFRFEFEDKDNSNILYCYEIHWQVSKTSTRHDLGRTT